jgi:AraC-like DNA-binding protein
MNQFLWSKTFFLFLLPIVLIAQSPTKNFAKLSYDDLKNLYFDNENKNSKQIEYAEAYLAKAKNENNPIRKAKGYYMYSLLNKNDKAISYLDSVIKYSTNSNDLNFPAAAYSEKGYILKKQFRYREAIDNFILAEKEAQKNNTDYYYKVKFSIAALRSEELGEVREALDLYRECFNYYRDKEVRAPQYSVAYQNVIFALADAHKALNQSDSATYFNKLGYRESKFTKDDEYNSLFILNEGANLVLKKNFRGALDSIKKALPKMIAYKNEGNILASYYYFGKAYDGLGQRLEAAKNFLKVDSLYKKTNRITPEFVSGYLFLISYYKDKGDKENQLKYLTTYMFIDSILQKNYKELTKKLQRGYDIPHLISEKEILIQSLENDKAKSYWSIGGLLLISIFVTGFGFYQHKLKKKYRLRFEKIINETSLKKRNPVTVLSESTEAQTKNNKEDIGIAEELIKQILEKLNHFETKKGYLQSNLKVQMLSTSFETNSKYVSKIVNIYKEKSFVQYINDLRIEYAIVMLQEDTKLRKYTLQALAMEFGFNSAESFSTAFYKKTKIKPIYFIKKLKILKDVND